MAWFLACADDPGVTDKVRPLKKNIHTYMHTYMHTCIQTQASHKVRARTVTKAERSAARQSWKRKFAESHSVWLRAERPRRDSDSESEPDHD